MSADQPNATDRTSPLTLVPDYCPIFANDPAKCDAIIGIRSALSVASLIGCLFVVFNIWLFKRYKYFSQRILLYLAVAAALDSFFRLCDLIPGPFACRFVAFLKTMSMWWIILVVLVITVNLLLNLYSRHTSDYEWIYLISCFGFPFFYSILPLFADKYGEAGVWCWIVQDTAWRFAIWYGPLFVILPTIAAIYAFIIIKKKTLIGRWSRTYSPNEEAAKEDLREEIRTLVVYPFIFIVLHTSAIIYRIYDAARPNEPSFALMFITAVCVSTQGAINAVAFFFDKQTRISMNMDSIRSAWSAHFAERSVVRSYEIYDVGQEGNSSVDRSSYELETRTQPIPAPDPALSMRVDTPDASDRPAEESDRGIDGPQNEMDATEAGNGTSRNDAHFQDIDLDNPLFTDGDRDRTAA